MKFFENMAKRIFNQEGIPILEGHVAYSSEEAMSISSEMGVPVVIKAQVLTGGRGKAGGVKFADNPGEALKVADEILGMEIKDEKVKHLLVEKKAEIFNEYFVTVSVDRGARKPVILASKEGGVEIENLAKTNPEKIIKYYPNPLIEFLPYEAREIARRMGVESELISQMGDIIWKLYKVFEKYDADTAEINPLVLTPDGLIAADAKLVVENDSLFRHQDLVKTLHYKEKAVDFVQLDGDIAVIGNGAGLTLTAMDMIKLNGGEPATFLDIGGGASEQIINQALNIVLNYDPVKVVFLNVLGGITKADDVARGVVKALDQTNRKVHIVIRLTGTNEKEGQKILEDAGIPFETSMEKAAKIAVDLCNQLKTEGD
ncbi:MAG: ADP-forming succinate--CoA ligase subunit beta [Methanobrevibacter thaueri]|nr:ADP-forming succinate--CoA ligase subunit beta [Methanobrevibacter thaueri]